MSLKIENKYMCKFDYTMWDTFTDTESTTKISNKEYADYTQTHTWDLSTKFCCLSNGIDYITT